jgi:quercetin dioxygenase-like cupin family protein
MDKEKIKSKLKPFVINLPVNDDSYFKILDESRALSLRSGFVKLKKDENVGEHTTSDYEEMLIILDGKGKVEINGKKSTLKIEKGEIAYIPPHTRHNVFNICDLELRYIYVVTKVVDI